ncbi:BglG family transcription antiterminator [Saccharibacillus sp. CPCC 101409]|uniref:BglG family transcription antiterminator n=1 Tax=Saccharibacillus sp. CPCC 101409 TaxID=3058041 RepID=UPI002673D919|nr:BglG family transcription antiterminator [Saccharibacillus sp. CPCC 101409]MDO3411331.1 BglG family transcription antiterminator [Saccharibacillus sp. CPCC 101409]
MDKPTGRLLPILKLLLASKGRFVTVRDLSDELDVSERTVKRELPGVEHWLSARGARLIRKPGAGVKLEAAPEQLDSLIEEMSAVSTIREYSRDERHYFLISELLLADEPVKSYRFASQFKVTESTLSTDLDRAEEWLEPFGLRLVRKPGYGVYVEGSESRIRSALIQLVYESIAEDQLAGLLSSPPSAAASDPARVRSHIRSRLLNLIDEGAAERLQLLVEELESSLDLKLTDSAYVGLAVHLALALQRIRSGQRIVIDSRVLADLKTLGEFDKARRLAGRLEEMLGIDIPEDEIGYITMHLKGAETRLDGEADNYYDHVSFELVRLARNMLKAAEAEFGYELKGSSKLFAGFVHHLGPAVERLRLGLDIRNPLLRQIREQYEDVFGIAAKCSEILAAYVDRSVPDSEVGYIAMHLGAMSEYARAERPSPKVLIACASGMGTSGLLLARVRKEFPVFNLIGLASASEAAVSREADFIISTVDVETDTPVVRVSALLSFQDVEQIRRFADETQRKSVKKKRRTELHTDLVGTLEEHRQTLEGILDLVKHVDIDSDLPSRDVDELIGAIAKRFTGNTADAAVLERELHERERLGETVLSQDGLILLHCRSEVVAKLTLGIFRFPEGIAAESEDKQPVRLKAALLLLAPKSSGKSYLQAAGEISKSLIDRPGFAARLALSEPDKLKSEIADMMRELYARKIEQYTLEVEQL